MSIHLGQRARYGLAACVLFTSCGGSAGSNPARQPVETAARPDIGRSERPVERRFIGGGPRDPDQRFRTTVAKVARAKCDREMRCGNVGPTEKFPTRSDCVSKSEADSRGDLNADDCLLGVSQTGFLACLKAIREDDCGNALEAMARLDACRSDNVCLK
jgi:hypothetical protein